MNYTKEDDQIRYWSAQYWTLRFHLNDTLAALNEARERRDQITAELNKLRDQERHAMITVGALSDKMNFYHSEMDAIRDEVNKNHSESESVYYPELRQRLDMPRILEELRWNPDEVNNG